MISMDKEDSQFKELAAFSLPTKRASRFWKSSMDAIPQPNVQASWKSHISIDGLFQRRDTTTKSLRCDIYSWARVLSVSGLFHVQGIHPPYLTTKGYGYQ